MKLETLKAKLESGPVPAFLWNSLYKECVPCEITGLRDEYGFKVLAYYRTSICKRGWVYLEEVIWKKR